jgi:hypothetical protein
LRTSGLKRRRLLFLSCGFSQRLLRQSSESFIGQQQRPPLIPKSRP